MSEMAASVPWSGEQLAWLQALGHTVYLDRDAVPEAPARAPAMAEPEPQPAAGAPAAAPAPRRQAPSAPETHAPNPAVAADAVAPRRGRVGLPDRLQIALLRASGLNPNDPATRTLMATWPLAELRASPAAKRALWPQLRALRRQARSRG